MNIETVASNLDAEALRHRGRLRLMEIKDNDIRILTLEQARTAIDRGLHAGGAFSATIPLVALYYSGLMLVDVANPTSKGQDRFVLSKGHAVATLASIYADLGYFDESVLWGSRAASSTLNGHPGPLLPGVHTATGPMGQGICVATGFAAAGRIDDRFDVFTVTGDGELQEGQAWEAVMYAGAKGLDNLCAIVDFNHGQLDNARALHLNMEGLPDQLRAFGWRVIEVDGTQYEPVYDALHAFKGDPRNGRPTAIISRTTKGWGAFAEDLVKHKTTVSDPLADAEIALQKHQRSRRVAEFLELYNKARELGVASEMDVMAKGMNLVISDTGVDPAPMTVRTRPAPPRDKRIPVSNLPELDLEQEYATDQVVRMAMTRVAADPRVVSIDSDLSSTSGLYAGIAAVDRRRALNVGIAEANMMAMGEAFAILGYNTWVSTFCPFFNWNVMRRIAVSVQEREEVIESDGWLTEGHGLDLTFLATAPNFETKTNGATHMGNDDVMVYGGVAHLKIIDVSCPNLLLGVMQWILEGNKGLVFVRVMRAASKVLYADRPEFAYGTAYTLRGDDCSELTIVSSGRGVHEALKASEILSADGIEATVIDMPSVDEQTLLALHDGEQPVLLAEQNNGFLYAAFRRVACSYRETVRTGHVKAINTLDDIGRPRFIHSATYGELLSANGLAPEQIADTCRGMLQQQRRKTNE